MSSNFDFIKSQWPELYKAALTAEQNVHTAPRTSAFYSRYSLEHAVKWMYAHDSSLTKPYNDKLSALMYEDSFVENLGTGLLERLRFLRELGNHAVHGGSLIKPDEAFKALNALHALFCWFMRTYGKVQPKEMLFKPGLIPKTGQVELSAKQLQTLQDQLAEKDAQLEEERNKQARYREELETLRAQIQTVKKENRQRISPMDYTEEETRRYIIDLELREAGWTLDQDALQERPVVGMPTPSGKGRVDYILMGDNGLPLAVLETKRTRKSEQSGQRQARIYADCLEKETGQRPIIFYSNGYKTWLWDDTFYPPRPVEGFFTKDQLQLLINRRSSRKPLADIPIGNTIVNRYYHNEGIKAVTESFTRGRRKALVVMATGTGKTQFAIALVKLMMRANWVRRVLFLADRTYLVSQARTKFKTLYPDASTVNLLTEKEDDDKRIVFSTYPTMMNCIDHIRGSHKKRFGVGHFDLIIIDEAHRSIYLKYKNIFQYFDALLLGLTATPKSDIHRNTYSQFDLPDNEPTHYYEYEQGVRDGYLAKYQGAIVPFKFHREGVHYKDLKDEDKEQYEALFYDEATGSMPEFIPSKKLNKHLFNHDTIDKVLEYVMEYGLKVQGGDRIGKTIIFAQNIKHANVIKERFDILFPDFKGKLMEVVTYEVNNSQELIEDFTIPGNDPAIAVSVDMLDTGIDIHQIVNLVFFKIVRSKAKFWQMIGRGSRICADLFGPGKDKTHFLIFDFYENFPYFDENPDDISPSRLESLSQKIFKNRVHLSRLLKDTGLISQSDNQTLYKRLLDILHNDVSSLNLASHFVRKHRKHVETYSRRERWEDLDISDISEIFDNLSPLLTPGDADHMARQFDHRILQLQMAIADNSRSREPLLWKLKETVASLAKLASVPEVNKQMELIRSMLSRDFSPTLLQLEHIRLALRRLVKFIDRNEQSFVYSDFQDTIEEITLIGSDLQQDPAFEDYRLKAEAFIRQRSNHITIYRLKHNQPITTTELDELERLLLEDMGLEDSAKMEEVYGPLGTLGRFIRSIVGLDTKAISDAFSKFLNNTGFNSQQIRFIKQIVDFFTRNGGFDKRGLYQQPFTDINCQGPDGLFSQEDVGHIIALIDDINRKASGL